MSRKPHPGRRLGLSVAVACAVWLTGSLPGLAAEPIIKVILLGTGTPLTMPGLLFTTPDPGREGTTTLIEAGGETLLFDAGRGVVNRLSEAGVTGKQITAVFLTHFHSDHTVGIPDLWLTSRLHFIWGNRKEPMEVWGPPHTQDFMAAIAKAYEPDLEERPHDLRLPLIGHDIARDGVAWEKNGVTVTSFTVEHGTGDLPAFGYRIDYKGHSVLLSGDTRYNENVIKYGKGVDLLIHEVIVVKPELLKARPDLVRIFNLHTPPDQAGKIFSTTKPKLAAYSHIVLFGGQAFESTIPAPSIGDLVQQTRETYRGRLAVGTDLMAFDIDAAGVTVRQAPKR